MTNTDKWLKDNVNVEELVKELCFKFYEKRVANYAQDKITIQEVLTNYFNEEATPTLTEDERVILKNIDKHFYTKIYRNECLFLRGEHTSDLVFTQYDHLFQFIQERRGVRNKRVIRRIKCYKLKKI